MHKYHHVMCVWVVFPLFFHSIISIFSPSICVVVVLYFIYLLVCCTMWSVEKWNFCSWAKTEITTTKPMFIYSEQRAHTQFHCLFSVFHSSIFISSKNVLAHVVGWIWWFSFRWSRDLVHWFTILNNMSAFMYSGFEQWTLIYLSCLEYVRLHQVEISYWLCDLTHTHTFQCSIVECVSYSRRIILLNSILG